MERIAPDSTPPRPDAVKNASGKEEEKFHVALRTYRKRKRVPHTTAETSRSPRKATKLLGLSKRKGNPQLHLDVGQKDFSGRKCPTCGFLYTPGVKVDEDLHSKVHKGGQKHIVHKGWKNERVVFYGNAATRERMIQITKRSPTLHREKLSKVCELIEEEIGLATSELLKGDYKALLQILDSRVVGCVVFEGNCLGWDLVHVRGEGATGEKVLLGNSFREGSAHKSGLQGGSLAESKAGPKNRKGSETGRPSTAKSFLPWRSASLRSTEKVINSSQSKLFGARSIAEAAAGHQDKQDVELGIQGMTAPNGHTAKQELESTRVWPGKQKVSRVCGVRVVWVSQDYRRKGIASRMLDVLRSDLVAGSRCKLAFFQQTVDGKEFCNAYLGGNGFWLYTESNKK